MHLKPDDGAGDRVVKVSVRPECFTGAIEELPWEQRKKYDEFDFGYVLTVHKAQGSQWDDVVLFDESVRVSREPRPLALHRRDAGGEAADGGGCSSWTARNAVTMRIAGRPHRSPGCSTRPRLRYSTLARQYRRGYDA